MHCQKNVLFNKFIRESSAIKQGRPWQVRGPMQDLGAGPL